MKKFIVATVLMLMMTLTSFAQTLKFQLDQVKFSEGNTNVWSKVEYLQKETYISMKGTLAHLHLTELNIDKDVNVVSLREYKDKSNNLIYEYGISNDTNSNELALLMTFTILKDGSGRSFVELRTTYGRVLFNISDVRVYDSPPSS